MTALALALIAGGLALSRPIEAPRSALVLDNGVLRVTFGGASGREHELATIEHLQDRRRIDFVQDVAAPRSSGGFGLLLRDRAAPLVASRCVWLFAGDPSFEVTPAVTGGGDRSGTEATFTYRAAVKLGSASLPIEVTARWRLGAGCDFLEADWSFTSPGLAASAYYPSQWIAPTLFVRHLGDPSHRHDLVVPSQGGLLFEDPLRAPTFPRRFAGKGDARPWVAPWVQVPLLAWYDTVTGNGLVLGDDDVAGCFRDYEVVRHERGADRFLELRCRHLPEDLLAVERFTAPYRMRITPFAGDWVDVAQRYRRFLADPRHGAAFYKGPVGARSDVSAEMKSLVFHAYAAPSFRSDGLDRLARDALDVRRLVGAGATLSIWSAGFHPDTFEQFYFHGWLPGRPSLAAAVREAQSLAGTIVAPYVNAACGVDWVEAGIAEPTPLMRTIRDAAIVTESGTRFLSRLGKVPADGECNGDSRWSKEFVANAVAIVRHTGARSLYLDAFATTPCFASAATGGAHDGHRPGGGAWMHAGRIAQLRAIRGQLAAAGIPFCGFTMEGHSLWYIGDVDVMHFRATQIAVTEGFDERGAPRRVEGVKTIPLFRMIADSVKLAPFDERPASTIGRRAWNAALDVFAFGLLPGRCNELVDLVASYGDEHDRERAPFDRYVRRLAGCLRDGFLPFHNGTLERPPEIRIEAGTFEPRGSPSATIANRTLTDPWWDGLLVAAIYRGARREDGIALVVTNPWIATPGAGALRFRAEVELRRLGLDVEGDGCTLTIRDGDGRELRAPAHVAGEVHLVTDELDVGAIRTWTFRD